MSLTNKNNAEPWDAGGEVSLVDIISSPSAPPTPQPPSPAAERARAAYEEASAATMGGFFSDAAPPFLAAKNIDPLRIAELERLTPEIHLVSPDLGDIFLVKQHSGLDRNELTYVEAATLRQMVDQFPGARVVTLRPAAAKPPAAKAAPEGWDA